MAETIPPIVFGPFRGMDEELSPDQLDTSMLRYLENMLCTNGRLSVRAGRSKYNSVEITGAGPIRGLATYYFKSGSSYVTQVVCVSDADIWKATAGTFTSCGATLTGTNQFSFAVIDNYLYAGDGVNDLQRWDGTTLVEIEGITAPATAPGFKQQAVPIDTCEASTGWSATGTGMAVASDATTYHNGSKSNKITGTTGSLNGYVQRDFGAGFEVDLSGSRYVGFWARATRAGTYIRFGIGEAAGNEIEASVVIDEADTWQFVSIWIEEYPQTDRDAIRYLRWTVENADAAFDLYVDQVQYSGGLTGEFLYRYSWYNSTSQVESGPSDDAMVVVSGLQRNSVQVGWVPSSAPVGVDKVRIYRTGSYSAVWRLVVETAVGAGGSATYVDQLSVDQLGDEQLMGGTAPPCAYLAAWKNRLCYAGDPSQPSRLYISNYEEPQQVPPISLLDAIESTGGFIDIDPADGDKISGIAAFGDMLIIFKHHSVHALQGTSFSNFKRTRLTDALGCASHWSVAQVASTLFWYTGEDVISWSQGGAMTVISNPVRSRVRGVTAARRTQVSGIVHDMKYLLAYPSADAVNDEVLVYDLRTGGWSVFTGWAVACWAALGGAGNDWDLYAGDAAAGYVWDTLSGLLDGATAISWTAEFPAMHLSALGLVKAVKEYAILATPAAADLTVSITGTDRGAPDLQIHRLVDAGPATAARDQVVIVSRPSRGTNGAILVFTLTGTTAVGTEIHRLEVKPEIVRAAR